MFSLVLYFFLKFVFLPAQLSNLECVWSSVIEVYKTTNRDLALPAWLIWHREERSWEAGRLLEEGSSGSDWEWKAVPEDLVWATPPARVHLCRPWELVGMCDCQREAVPGKEHRQSARLAPFLSDAHDYPFCLCLPWGGQMGSVGPLPPHGVWDTRCMTHVKNAEVELLFGN